MVCNNECTLCSMSIEGKGYRPTERFQENHLSGKPKLCPKKKNLQSKSENQVYFARYKQRDYRSAVENQQSCG